ncbi:ependymin-like 1 [Centroberyx affinis]|uniref:ependymin-like 1 n=1 Tax=Centroberyx affinis TaxID=166261 RepID=UPI003A5C0796
MRGLIVLFVCLTVGCLAQRPQPCKSPPLLTGGLAVFTQSEKVTAYAKYTYDALGKRVRLQEIVSYENKTLHIDVLVLFREGVLYKINQRNRSCIKKHLRAEFQPLEVPKDASLMGQSIMGSSSGPGQGLLVNTWQGELDTRRRGKAKYMSTVTEFGCIPISTLFHTDGTGWVLTSFFNNVLGIEDPQQFIPPPYCEEAQLDGEGPADFYSLFY